MTNHSHTSTMGCGARRRRVLTAAMCALTFAVLGAGATRAEAAFGEFESLAESPVILTSVAVDPATGVIYAQQNSGKRFFSYNPGTGTWSELAEAPLTSGNNGGATFLNGKVYTDYTGNSSSLGVYDVESNSWTTIPNPLGAGTADITAYGGELYMVVSREFVKYNPATEVTTTLAEPPGFGEPCEEEGFEPWGGLQPYKGKLYGDQGNGCRGFAVYDPESNTWTELPETPEEEEEGPVEGSAIDPVTGTYFAYGDYSGEDLFTYDIASKTWTTSTLPFVVDDGGLAYVPLAGLQGIYMIQGQQGTVFGRIRTPEPGPEVHETTPPPSTPTSSPAATTSTALQSPAPTPMCVVPAMHGMNRGQVEAALRSAHCALGAIERHYNSIPRGDLTEQDRHQGTILPAGTKVDVWFSLGRRPRHHRHHQRSGKKH